MKTNIILQGDALEKLKELPEKSVDMVMTSPPYWALRDYDIKGQLGLEKTFDKYIKKLCKIFDEIKRILKNRGTIWVNLGDVYYGSGAGTQKNNVEPSGKQVYVMPYGSNRTRNWSRPSRKEYSKSGINKNCLYCGKKIKGKPNSQFCSRNCLNKMGNDFRSQRRLLLDKCLVMIPFRFAIEMVNHGWILRNTIIWHKPNAMPSSVKDRFTVDFEYVFLFSKQKNYYFKPQYEPNKTKGSFKPFNKRVRDVVAGRIASSQYKASEEEIERYKKYTLRQRQGGNTNVDYRNPEGRNKRTTWFIPIKPFQESHFAIYPEKLCEIPLKAGCPEGGIVLDPFFGSGTTGLVALKQGKKFIGIELNPEYIKIAENRLKGWKEQTRLICS